MTVILDRNNYNLDILKCKELMKNKANIIIIVVENSVKMNINKVKVLKKIL